MSTDQKADRTPDSELLPLREVERRHIRKVLIATGGHRTEAARILGLDRKTLYRKLLKFGLDENELRPRAS